MIKDRLTVGLDQLAVVVAGQSASLNHVRNVETDGFYSFRAYTPSPRKIDFYSSYTPS